MQAAELSYTRGTLAGVGATILLAVFGTILSFQLLTDFWLLGIFGPIMLMTAFCFTGIDFNTEEKTYREFYGFLFFKFGKWHSYENFKFVSLHNVNLAGTINVPYLYSGIKTDYGQSAKIILLNQNHSQKLFIVYSKDGKKTKKIVDELISGLKMEFSVFQPPVSQARLRRKSKT